MVFCARGSGLATGFALLPYAALTLAMPVAAHNYLEHALLGVPTAVVAWLITLRWSRHPLWPHIEAAAIRTYARLLKR